MRKLHRRPVRTNDSALAYFINQLENLDPRLYEPLFSVTWGRDIKLRSGIVMGQESTSFIRSTFAAPGSLKNVAGTVGSNMSWVSPTTTAIPGVQVNGQKITLALRPLAREVSYTSLELDRSQQTGQPIDVQQINALNSVYQMNTDQMVYVGDSAVGATGLVNDPGVVAGAVANGVSGSPLWSNKTPDEIVEDVNTLLNASYAATGYSMVPKKLGLPPTCFSQIASAKVSSAGNISILQYIKDNSLTLAKMGVPLEIVDIKWLETAGDSSSRRMVAYTNEENFVRFPMVPIRRETPYYQGIRFSAPYLWLFGEVEVVYPETIRYADGI